MQMPAYDMRISDWSSDVCSSDLVKFTPVNSANQTFILPFHKERKIKNSFGLEENRYIVHTHILMFNQEYEIEISLRDRSNMEFPMLLGRKIGSASCREGVCQ